MKRTIALALAATAGLLAETRLGKPLTLKEPVSVTQVESHAADYVGKTVQVKGKVTEVCQMAGCWMAIAEPGTTRAIRIKVNDGDIVFPKEAVGKIAIAEGKLTKIELTKEQAQARAKHDAEERNQPFRPESVKTGTTLYQVEGSGAVLLD